MAEALGTVASVIAVVDLAGKAVTAEELQDLDDFLRDAESNAANNPLPNSVWNGTIMQNAIGRARAAMDDFQRALDTHIDSLADKRRRKQKLAAAKIVFQKGSLEAMERKLDRALRLFRMAQNQYCVMCASTVVERLPKPLSGTVERLPQSTGEFDAESAEADDFVGSEHYFHEFLRLRKSHLAKPFPPDAAAMSKGTTMLGRLGFGFSFQRSHISFRTPRWLGNSVYSLMAQKSMSGWQLNLSSHEVMDSFPGSILDAVRCDDIINLQNRLRQISLTPYVHDRVGSSLLCVAAFHGAVEVSRWLLSIGLCPGFFGAFSLTYLGKGQSQYQSRTPLERLLKPRQNSEQDINRNVDILRAFTAYAPDSVEDDDGIWDLVLLNRTFDHYREIQQVMSPELLLAPFQVRLWHCVKGLFKMHWTFDEIMCLLPEVRSMSVELVISFWSMSGECLSLSHLIARGVSWEFLKLNGELLQPLAKGSYCSVLGDIARSSPDDLSLFEEGTRETPLMIFDRVLQSAITSWASILHMNGVNLLDYGCRERFSELRNREGRIPDRSQYEVLRFSYFRILGITYGALPEQWKVWWSIYDYEYAGEFWHMVENSAFSIPGSWKDDFDSYAEDDYEEVPWDDDDRGNWMVWSEYRRIRPPC
ncbi:hypothetical protein CcaCcLH18_03658 [Colletotrichum camelliae]|nr:hypothetical protein CcaCcLH18_03658 [Colletotrichum camelliae]